MRARAPACTPRSRTRRGGALALPLALCLALGLAPLGAPAADWAFDPAEPGPDLPPAGRSLADHLLQGGGQALPATFEGLRARLAALTQPAPDAAVPGLKQVLIPLGRSLQRSAAAPDVFASPRVVLAVDEPPRASPGQAGLLLKDRLYVGYQARAGVAEVISWNEAAGRFEFQVVKELREGATPRVVYARRALCVACHQNGGPIFSLPAWDETNANARVAARLVAAAGRAAYGVPVERGVDVPNAIDDATDRANRYAAVQRLWREGCGGDEPSALACRAALFTAVLQYRLSGERQFDAAADGWRRDVQAPLAARAAARWPAGLALGNPDLPDRDPLGAAPQADVAALLDVAAAFDPLLPRPPLEVWQAGDPALGERLVAGLAEFLAAPDVARLEARLAQAPAHPARRYEGACRIAARGAEDPGAERLDFECAAPPGSAAPLALQGHLELAGGRVAGGEAETLALGAAPALRRLALGPGRLQAAGAQRRVRLPVLGAAGRRARSGGGDAVEALELAWSGATGTAVALVARDFAAVAAAVEALLQEARAGRFDGSAALPFRRARLMPALFERLGMPRLAWCCLDAAGLPPAVPDDPAQAVPGAGLAGAARGYYRHCAACHLSAERFPPNFLQGDAAQVERQLAHCAERLYVRLAMWQREPSARAKTPMPPAAALRRTGYAEAAWRDGAELAQLGDDVAARLAREGARAPAPEALLARPYESLRPCLPAPAAHP